ncbi:MAG: hypothetical protein GC157_07215 [Frankiales bacterium]|nr:hypothetical protein [Frankiales bacterium]
MTRTLDVDTVTLAGKKLSADLTAAITDLTVDYTSQSVAQMTLTCLDSGPLASSALMVNGTTVTWRGDSWDVGGRTTTRGDDNTIVHTFPCRSPLARKLRKTYRASAERKVSPSQWVARRVAAAHGTSVCQASSKRGIIAQTTGRNRQSTLDVIANLASDLGWSWVESGGRLLFGSRHWAWKNTPAGQRTYTVTWGRDARTDALASELTLDDDDAENYGTGTVTVPYPLGRLLRPWDLLHLDDGFGRDRGTWLIDSLTFTADGVTPITVQVAQPRRPAKKAGSSS